MSYLHPQFGSVSSIRTVSERSDRTSSRPGHGCNLNTYDTPVPSQFGSISSVPTVSERPPIRPCRGCTQNMYDTPASSRPVQRESEDVYDSIENNCRVTRQANDSQGVNRRYVRTGDIPEAALNDNDHRGLCAGSISTASQMPWKSTRILKRTRRRNTQRCILLSVVVGIIVGAVLCLVSWLFLDKLEHAIICCEIKHETNVDENNNAPNSDVTRTVATRNITGTPTISSAEETKASINAFATNLTSTNVSFQHASTTDVSTRPLITTSTSRSSVVDASTPSLITNTLSNAGTSTNTTPNITTDEPHISQTTSPSSSSTQSKGTTVKTVSASSTPTVLVSTATSTDKRNAYVPGGYVYTRWGSFECSELSELIYKGHMAGGHYSHPGGATNTICLPEVPEWGNYSDGADTDRVLIYGTEYGSNDGAFNKLTGENLRNKDVPCTVCQATGRSSYIMMPAKTSCLPEWTQEYQGYLMGSAYLHNHASQLVCVDSSPDHVANSDTVSGGNFLYFAEVRTGILPNPPYLNGREIPCVICTK